MVDHSPLYYAQILIKKFEAKIAESPPHLRDLIRALVVGEITDKTNREDGKQTTR